MMVVQKYGNAKALLRPLPQSDTDHSMLPIAITSSSPIGIPHESEPIRAVPLGFAGIPLTDYVYDYIDLLYYAPMCVGTPCQRFAVDVDTGSADTWVPDKNCDGTCQNARFDPKQSSTYHDSKTRFSGSGSVSGKLATETVRMGPFAVDNQTIGLVKRESEEWSTLPSDGLLGCAFGSIAMSGKPTFFENLISSGNLARTMFGVHLERGKETGSELMLGGADETKTSGPITWHPVVSKTYWTVHLTGFAVDNQYTPADEELVMAIPGAEPLSNSGPKYYVMPCTSSHEVALVFDNIKYTINPLDFNLGRVDVDGQTKCVGGIIGLGDEFPSDLAIIGDEFLKSWYSVYDQSKEPRVGFAPSINNHS
ncbi:hypothetical protein ONZ45_g6587 [Pleurotus djamor]|nr:hypothetical protein ONZ45_g18743 [Pleurotus djamor]KAJ8516066.1 hypothetical protein ONZ45_g6587 [Pleurotus djamor]